MKTKLLSWFLSFTVLASATMSLSTSANTNANEQGTDEISGYSSSDFGASEEFEDDMEEEHFYENAEIFVRKNPENGNYEIKQVITDQKTLSEIGEEDGDKTPGDYELEKYEIISTFNTEEDFLNSVSFLQSEYPKSGEWTRLSSCKFKNSCQDF